MLSMGSALCLGTSCSGVRETVNSAISPQRTQAEVGAVTLRTPSPINSNDVNAMHIVSVDGRPPFPYDYEAVFFPGRHTIYVDVNYTVPGITPDDGTTTHAVQAIELNSRPGHDYRIHYHQISGEDLRLWIVDESAAQEVVAGQPPR